MRFVFLGSADLAAIALKALVSRYGGAAAGAVAVVTQPDRPRGRNLAIAQCAAKSAAVGMGIPVCVPDNINAPESLRVIASYDPDLVIVVAYGQILKPALLAIPSKGCINLHASLLPKYRGAAPIQWAIANGERVTGITTMHVNERMDAGDIIFQETVEIRPDDTAADLHNKLAEAGATLLVRTVDAICAGGAPRVAQDGAQATYAPKLKKEDGRIDWTMSAESIYNRIRGFHPWPGCFCEPQGKQGDRLKVLGSRKEAIRGAPGQLLDVQGDGPVIGAGDGAIRLIRVQPGGKRVMSGTEYVRGHAMQIGDVWR